MKPKTQKKEELKQLKERIPSSKMVVFTTFSKEGEKGLSVAQMTELKRILMSLGSEYVVAKKSLADMAIKSSNYDGIDIFSINGSIGLALVKGDHYLAAKKLYEFSRKNPSLSFSGAFIDGTFVDASGFLEIAKMPSKEVLIGRLLGMLTYPIRGLAVALSEISKKKVTS